MLLPFAKFLSFALSTHTFVDSFVKSCRFELVTDTGLHLRKVLLMSRMPSSNSTVLCHWLTSSCCRHLPILFRLRFQHTRSVPRLGKHHYDFGRHLIHFVLTAAQARGSQVLIWFYRKQQWYFHIWPQAAVVVSHSGKSTARVNRNCLRDGYRWGMSPAWTYAVPRSRSNLCHVTRLFWLHGLAFVSCRGPKSS